VSKNDITGDALRSRPLSLEGKANWDRIFAPKKKCSCAGCSGRGSTMPTRIFCPECGCELDPNDHVFGVWVCPACDVTVADLEPMDITDLPEAP
jgi:hypothetical protein